MSIISIIIAILIVIFAITILYSFFKSNHLPMNVSGDYAGVYISDEEEMPVTASPNYQYLVEAFKTNNEIRKQLLKDLETVNDLLSKINVAMKQESKR